MSRHLIIRQTPSFFNFRIYILEFRLFKFRFRILEFRFFPTIPIANRKSTIAIQQIQNLKSEIQNYSVARE